MACIGRQDNPPPRRMDSHHLQASGMPTYLDQLDTRRNFTVTVMKNDTLLIHAPHNIHDVFDVEGMTQRRIKHVSPSGEIDLRRLHVKPRIRQKVDIACVVIMHVRDNHVLQLFGAHS
ncbi:hypothetical protein D3C77_300730 [compost metagenome]